MQTQNTIVFYHHGVSERILPEDIAETGISPASKNAQKNTNETMLSDEDTGLFLLKK